MPTDAVTEVGGHRLALTHLDKPLWHDFTKGQALHYYARIAPVMLPHLSGRPASFVRFPDGADGPRFYAQTPPRGLPGWVTTLAVPDSHGGQKTRVEVADLATLIAVGNLYALEIHTSQWRQPGPAMHDRLVVDLDPGPGRDVADCALVARGVRVLLEQDGLSPLVKTSGAKGLHVMAPLAATPAERTVGYARALARRLEAIWPDLVVSRIAKALRPGKVMIDFSQNASAKTTAAPYTLRAGDMVAVSAPVTWQELEACGDARDLALSPEQVLERADRHGDLLAGLLDPAKAAPLPDADT
jgi:bifunctional non-homologous end joining protein LigD